MSKSTSTDALRERMQTIDAFEFEDFVADLLEEEGWNTEVTQGRSDGGIDVVATQNGTVDQKMVVQAKRYTGDNKVGSSDVRQYAGVRQREVDADSMAIFTTSEFTRGAKDESSQLNIKLVDGDALAEMVREHDQEELVAEYENEPEPEPEAETGQTESASTADTSTKPSKSDYFRLVALAFFVQVGGIALSVSPSLLPALSADAALYIFVLGWFASPVLVFADANDVHGSGASYKPNRLIWPTIVLMLSVIGLLLYVNKRLSN